MEIPLVLPFQGLLPFLMPRLRGMAVYLKGSKGFSALRAESQKMKTLSSHPERPTTFEHRRDTIKESLYKD